MLWNAAAAAAAAGVSCVWGLPLLLGVLLQHLLDEGDCSRDIQSPVDVQMQVNAVAGRTQEPAS
jgi:hypothetical protein